MGRAQKVKGQEVGEPDKCEEPGSGVAGFGRRMVSALEAGGRRLPQMHRCWLGFWELGDVFHANPRDARL